MNIPHAPAESPAASLSRQASTDTGSPRSCRQCRVAGEGESNASHEARALCQRANQYVAFTRNTLLGRAKISRTSLPALKSPSNASNALRDCCHTKKRADPGRYSHRTTAFPRRECVLKSGLLIVNGDAGPAPSGSTRYDSTFDEDPVCGVIVLPTSRPYRS